MTIDKKGGYSGGRPASDVVPPQGVQHPSPPVARYRYTLTLTGNSVDEIESELLTQTRGGFLIDSDYEKRDEWHVAGGCKTSVMKQVNPGMTADRYAEELDAWWRSRKASRA